MVRLHFDKNYALSL